jgi:hypothetical protein
MIRERLGTAGFAMGALSAPIALLASGSCGASCGSCPAGGACMLGAPIVLGAVYLTNRKIRSKEPDASDDVPPEEVVESEDQQGHSN